MAQGRVIMISIYTDGSCLGNPGPGGWGTIVIEDGSRRELHGGQAQTTNNRMEILAVIKGLQAVPASSDVKVFSDSQYVINTITRNWKRNANRDLWTRLDAELGKRKVQWEWVRGHAGDPLNEEADRLANQEAQSHSTERPSRTLTHVDKKGTARMVDVGAKPETQRVAVARGIVLMQAETLKLIKENGFEKGDVLGVARLAGIMGAKSTSQLIPLCHPIPLNQVTVELTPNEQSGAVEIEATARTAAKTGVEMEALTAVSVAALTVYDMCKSADREMRIDGIRLVKKTGGRSGDLVLEE